MQQQTKLYCHVSIDRTEIGHDAGQLVFEALGMEDTHFLIKIGL